MSATARNQVFSAVHTVGGLLPADMLVRISEGKDVSGSKPADYRRRRLPLGPRRGRTPLGLPQVGLAELREKLPVAPEADDRRPTRPAWPSRSGSHRSSRELGFGG